MKSDQPQTTDQWGRAEIDDDPLLEEMEAAVDGAYYAAPSGEGVSGSLFFAARAAVLVARGMKAPEAVAKAIGEVGIYGVPRKYKLVPREPGDSE